MKFDIFKLTARIRGLFHRKKPEQTYKPDVNYERDYHKLSFEEFHSLSFRDNNNDDNNIHTKRSSDLPY